MYKLPLLQRPYVSGKTVFLRTDLDVPLSTNFQIEDDTRLLAGVETIKYLRDCASRIIIAGHLGRPNGKESKYSLLPIAKWFHEKFGLQNSKFNIQKVDNYGFEGWVI